MLNIPFLAYQLALLRRHGIGRVVLSCSYLVDEVRRTMGDGTGWSVRSICKERGTEFCGRDSRATEGGNENAILFPVQCASICASSNGCCFGRS